MNALGDMSPTLDPTQLAAGHAPPTPPHENALDDIYGSAPASPTLSANIPHARAHEILSDLPSRQRALDTDAYREGLANSKGKYVQEGFDEGYSLGANLGLRVGYILGVLQGFVAAWRGHNEQVHKEVAQVFDSARKELAIEELLGRQWVDEEGIWKWGVVGKDDDPTFREVSDQHPVVKKWMGVVEDLAKRWDVDLKAVEKSQVPQDEQS
ncbi:Essential protein Yae1, N terminal [Alternaria rosae]|nr:Essential protein Yae1, N terminal [Alternaria rosae]